MTLGRAEVLAHGASTRFRRVGAEGVVLVQDRREVLGVNRVGARVLELADGEMAVGLLLERMAAEFDAAPETLEADVIPFLEELVSAGVLEIVR